METDVNKNIDFELWAALFQTRDTMARCRERELREGGTGISGIQASVLWIVKNIPGPPTPAEISRWVFREPHTLSMLLKQMEKQGLVKKVKDLERRNLVRVVVTEKGEEAYRQSRENAKVIDEIISCLSQEEKANLLAYLEKLRSKALERLGRRELHLPYDDLGASGIVSP